ncbi:hypothetical protein PI125_g3785 [Phytophthora idaei]|nr:hypothetical protein PI125_g3785 [Phytophthora idaei]
MLVLNGGPPVRGALKRARDDPFSSEAWKVARAGAAPAASRHPSALISGPRILAFSRVRPLFSHSRSFGLC